jgi:HSP20 family molecular chaperone IbpA
VPRDEIEELNRFGESFDGFFMRALAGIQSTLFDLESKSLRPLSRLDMDDKTVTVTFDLPHVNKKDLGISATEDSLTVEARMRKPVALRVRTAHRRTTMFEKYSERVLLPARVVPSRAKAKFANGILVVKIPRAPPSKAIKIS